MPAIISNLFPHYAPLDDDAKIHALLVNADNKQTKLGDLLEEDWESIPDTDRLLMMLCWASCQRTIIYAKSLLSHL